MRTPRLAAAMLLGGPLLAAGIASPAAADCDHRGRSSHYVRHAGHVVAARTTRPAMVRHAARPMAAARPAAPAAPARIAAPGRCGTYFYFRGGRCVDARVTAPRPS